SGSVMVTLTATPVAPAGTPMAATARSVPAGSAGPCVRVSTRRTGANSWKGSPTTPNHPVASTTRWVAEKVNRHTLRVASRPTTTRLGVGSPTRGLTFDVAGRGEPHG